MGSVEVGLALTLLLTASHSAWQQEKCPKGRKEQSEKETCEVSCRRDVSLCGISAALGQWVTCGLCSHGTLVRSVTPASSLERDPVS